MKIRKLIVISPLGLALLALLAAAWWFLGNDAWIKGKIEDTVSEMTGRTLSIDGAFDLDWSTNPVLTAENIHFSNPPWAVNRDLARLDNLEVSVDLFSLFTDQVKINYVAAKGLVVALEKHESGERSWQGIFPAKNPDRPRKAPPAELPISVGRVTLADFSLVHEAPDRTVPLDFHLEQLEVIQLVDQQLQFKTDGRFGGEQFDLVGDLGPVSELIAGGKTSHEIILTMGEISLLSRGSIEQSSTFSGANINLTFSGREFEWLLTQLALPLFSHGDFDFRLDLQTDGEQTHLDLDGDLGSLQAHAKGGLRESDAGLIADLTAAITGDDLGGLLEVVGIAGIPRSPFNLQADIEHAMGMSQVKTLVLETADDRFSISGQIGDWPELRDTDLEILFSGPDLQKWGSALSTELLPQSKYEVTSHISRAGSQPVSTDTRISLGDDQIRLSGSLGKLPSMTGADLAIAIDGLVDGALLQTFGIEGVPGRNFSLSAEVKRDISYFYLNDASFDLAENHLELSGRAGPWPELKDANLVFSLAGPELSTWSNLLGIEDLPASAFSLSGEVSSTAAGVNLEAIKFKLADSTINLHGILGEWPGLIGTELDVEVVVPSLAGFGFIPVLQDAPDLPLTADGIIGMNEAGLTFDNFRLTLDDNDLHLNGLMGLDNQFEGSNLQTRLTLPSLARIGPLIGIEDLPDGRLSVNGNYRRVADGWEFQLANGSLAGASFESDGSYLVLDSGVQIEATSQVSAPDLAELARFAGVEGLPGLPVSIKGFARYHAEKIELREIQGNVGDSFFNVTANLVNTPGWAGSDISLSMSGPDFDQLLVNREIEDVLPFSFEGSITRGKQGIRMNRVNARLGLLEANADGVIGKLEDASDTDIQFAISSPSLQNIGELLDFPLPDDPFNLSARFVGSPSEFQAEQLEITLGNSDLSGDVSVNLNDRPVINSVLRSSNLDLTWLQKKDKTDGTEQNTAEKGKKDYLIPDTPIKYSITDIADIDINISIDSLAFPHSMFSEIKTKTRVKDGNLFVDTFQLRSTGGGLLEGTGTVEREPDSDIMSVGLSVEGHGVKLRIGIAEDQDPETIPQSEIVANLSGKGVTYRDLAKSLDGYIEVVQGPGLSENAGFGLLFGDFINELLSMLNPFAKTEKFIQNECAVGIVNIESGFLTLDPMVVQLEKLTIVAKGAVDLHTEELEFTFRNKLRKGLGISASMVVNPFVEVSGTLASPSIGLDPEALAVKGTVAVATVGISLLAKSLADRFLSSKDPCGDALKKAREQFQSSENKGG